MEREELKKVLELHRKWVYNEAGGELADLSGAVLSWANLSGAVLSGANLSGANLSWANLSGANLSWANLSGATLYNTIGDGRILRTMQLSPYTITVCDDWVQIGCRGHRVHEWAAFPDERIRLMDSGALEWWHQHKALVMAFVDSDGMGNRE